MFQNEREYSGLLFMSKQAQTKPENSYLKSSNQPIKFSIMPEFMKVRVNQVNCRLYAEINEYSLAHIHPPSIISAH